MVTFSYTGFWEWSTSVVSLRTAVVFGLLQLYWNSVEDNCATQKGQLAAGHSERQQTGRGCRRLQYPQRKNLAATPGIKSSLILEAVFSLTTDLLDTVQ